jgi:hypothetical protein
MRIHTGAVLGGGKQAVYRWRSLPACAARSGSRTTEGGLDRATPRERSACGGCSAGENPPGEFRPAGAVTRRSPRSPSRSMKTGWRQLLRSPRWRRSQCLRVMEYLDWDGSSLGNTPGSWMKGFGQSSSSGLSCGNLSCARGPTPRAHCRPRTVARRARK